MIPLALLAGWMMTAEPADFSASLRARGEKSAASSAQLSSDGRQLLLEVEVVGVPDEEWGELVTAVVEARDPISLDGVRDLVEPRSWAPRRLVVLRELPRLGGSNAQRDVFLLALARIAGAAGDAPALGRIRRVRGDLKAEDRLIGALCNRAAI